MFRSRGNGVRNKACLASEAGMRSPVQHGRRLTAHRIIFYVNRVIYMG